MNEGGLLGARELRELFARHDVRPLKSLGQNFVIDPNTIRKVVAAAGISGDDVVLEIGAGGGSLTVALAACAARVIAVEVSPPLVAVLGETMRGRDNVEVVERDVMSLDLGEMAASKLVANLPYNIASTVVLKALEEAPSIRELTVMTQREVGERLAASEGNKVYGQTSVLVAFFGKARVVTSVSRRAFWPEPNVDSVVVKITRTPTPSGADKDTFFEVVKAAFSQRRKTLRNVLVPVVGSPAATERLLAAAGISASTRAEEIAPQRFMDLARLVAVARQTGAPREPA